MYNIGNAVESKTYFLGKSITGNSFLTEVFDGYEIWSGKCDISAVFSVTPYVRILFRHPLYFSTAPSDGLFRQLFLKVHKIEIFLASVLKFVIFLC